VPLLLGGDFRRRLEVERLRVVAFAPLDFRAVGDFRLLAALVPVLAVDDLRRVVDFVPDADLRRVVALVPDAALRLVVVFFADAALGREVDTADDLRRDVDLRLVVVFFADAALGRDVDAADDLRRDVDDLRFDVEPPVTRLVNPARALAAFSICATPFATSCCAAVTALSTVFRPLDRFDLVVFRAAIAFSRQVLYLPLGCCSMERLARAVDNTLLTHNTPCHDTVDASSQRVHETAALRRPR
jgi:hypothetical protein